jgi:hypothetical protein
MADSMWGAHQVHTQQGLVGMGEMAAPAGVPQVI